MHLLHSIAIQQGYNITKLTNGYMDDQSSLFKRACLNMENMFILSKDAQQQIEAFSNIRRQGVDKEIEGSW